ncbi:phthiocerol/phthiodiolone dimycocerosyl transferase family protein [Mycobacterium sp.]|uniref:phthiocerol/phthiodiolone dimycocerosyl transferase family protein n=1 Tax=Mycobacterium sp. TaxID=1785 RepID=UPI003C739B43
MTTELRRALSPVERWYWIADQVSPLNVVARVHLRGSISWGLLKRAARALVAEHPLLRVAITSEADGTNPAFVSSQSVCPIRRVHGDELEWERQADEHELATSLNWRRGPLVRIVDVMLDSAAEEHDLMLTVSHNIADGTTALALLQRLIEHADRLAAVQDTGDLVASRPAIGAPEDLLPARYRGPRGVTRMAVTGLADLLAGALGARPSRLLPEVGVRPSLRRTRLVRRKLTATQLDSLTRRCREEGVTVHGALAAAMAMVIGPAAAQRSSGRICIGSPVDFRAELNPPVSSDEAGAYVCTVPSIVRFGRRHDLWSIARQVNRSLRRRKRIGQHFALLSALRFMSPTSVTKSAKTFGLLERFGPGNVCISNLGRYGFAARIGDWQLSGGQFIAGVSVSGYLAATVNTSHGELFWNFNYIDNAVSRRSAQRFADGCVQTLLGAIAETNEKKVCNDQVSSDHRRVERVGEGRRYSPL